MNYNVGRAPFLRNSERQGHFCLDVGIALAPLFIFSGVYYGMRPLLILLVSVSSAVGWELIGSVFLRRTPAISDGTAVITGAVIAAVMSPLSPFWIPVVASGFAILIVKLPFGSTGRNIFNPAAGGVAFVSLCFGSALFTYPAPDQSLRDMEAVITQNSPSWLLAKGGNPAYETTSVLLGNFPGPIGAVAILVLLACAVYLFVRRVTSPLITLPYLATCALLALLFARGSGNPQTLLLMEMCAGYLLFAGVFMIPEPITAPRSGLARMLYGVLAGVLVMCLRHFGRYEEGCCFAVLLVNLFSSAMDRWCWRLTRAFRVYRQKSVEDGSYKVH